MENPMLKFSKTVLVIDDNRVALMLSGKMVQNAVKDLSLQSFSSAQLAMDFLKDAKELPSAIFSDLNMEGISGLDLLGWCKRHPSLHHVPFIIFTAESQLEDLASQGALAICLKPLQQDAVDQAFEKAKNRLASLSLDDGIESAFVEESFELLERFEETLKTKPLDEKNINEIYRIFHTIKGVSSSLDYTYLSHFIHKAESFLTLIKNKNRCSHPQVHHLLQEIHRYFFSAFSNLKKHDVMPTVEEGLHLQITKVEEFLDSKWLTQDAGAPAVVVQVSQDTSNIAASIASSKSETLRVKHKELDEIQAQLKKIIQLKVQLNLFGRQLNEEFYDESFPKDLIQMVTKLEQSSLMALESLIMLRVQPLENLKPYAEKLVQELCQKLNKSCQIFFTKSSTVEVDTPIIELMRAALTHILRNALDHGIETEVEREQHQKTKVGKIEVYYEKLPNKTFKVEIRDDGRGIIKNKLKNALIEKKILTEEQVKDMNDHQINQMIFVDGLSTKTEVSDISGRGVGISAVKDDIEKMGGSLTVESHEGKGTTFVITLPLYFVL